VLAGVRPDDLSALVIRALARAVSAHLMPQGTPEIDDVLWGCANQAGEDNRNIGRMAALLAGLPQTVPGTTINRLCGSSLDAAIQAARAIWSGDAEVLVAGGVESMSRAPYSLPKNQSGAFGNLTAYDTALGWRYPNPAMASMFPLESMGETAENVAGRYRVTREAQDLFALESHRRAVEAQRSGRFAAELIPVELPSSTPGAPKGTPESGARVERDQGPRADTSLEKLARLPPVFRKGGTVTAGNSSSLSDGAAGVVVMEERRAGALGLPVLGRIVSTGIAGVDPRYMGIGPVPAAHEALRKASLTAADMDVIELNEAFASQSLAVIAELGLDTGRVNPNGGAIALGHPLGCSGARILTTLVHELQRTKGRFGLAAMCIGVGQGIALVVERGASPLQGPPH
jgi:acetyl-CoA C-acetyltransferase